MCVCVCVCVCVYLSNHGCLIERGEKLRDLEHMREGEGEGERGKGRGRGRLSTVKIVLHNQFS